MRETLSYSYTIMTEGEKLDKIKDAIDDTAVVKATKKYKQMGADVNKLISEIRVLYEKKEFKKVNKKIENMFTYIDMTINELRAIKNTDNSQLLSISISIFQNLLLNIISGLVLVIINKTVSRINGEELLATKYLPALLVISRTFKDIKDLIKTKKNGENYNTYIDLLIKSSIKIKLNMQKMIIKLNDIYFLDQSEKNRKKLLK